MHLWESEKRYRMKGIIWGTGELFSQHINCIKYHEYLDNLQVVGVTSKNYLLDEVLGYPFICKEKINDVSFDIIVIMADKKIFYDIKKEAIALGVPETKIISYRIFLLPQIDLKKYVEIIANPPTILANNCWGGLTYHQLGLEFSSPLINMFETDEDYLKLLKNPQKYMEYKLEYVEDRYEPILQRNYPLCRCGDILLYFNHYVSFAEASECWERRKKRINWNNLFVMMLTEDKAIARRFSELPYTKKICFVPFRTQLPSMVYIDFYTAKTRSNILFSQIINGMASGANLYYDPIELLYSCDVKKLIT